MTISLTPGAFAITRGGYSRYRGKTMPAYVVEIEAFSNTGEPDRPFRANVDGIVRTWRADGTWNRKPGKHWLDVVATFSMHVEAQAALDAITEAALDEPRPAQ